MSTLTRGGNLGVYFTADDEAPPAPTVPDGSDRVSMITGTAPPPADPMTPGAPAKAQPPAQVVDYTGLALGMAGIVAMYFLMSR